MLYPGLDISLLTTWMNLTYALTIVGVFVIYLPEVTPSGLLSLYQYGKSTCTSGSAEKGGSFTFLSVPKRWFTHFYVTAVIFLSFVLFNVYGVYLFGGTCPEFLSKLLRFLSYPTSRNYTVFPESVLIATTLLFLQAVRRLYECLFVSVFSKATMSVVHYIFGMYYYVAVGISLIIEAPGFVHPYPKQVASFTKEPWTNSNHVVGILLFLLGSWIEYQSLGILASMRKNNKGEVVSQKHDMPRGGLFELVSCPHYLGEVLMYVAVGIIFSWQNVIWTAVVANVVLNQMFAAKMSHEWYRKHFSDYPKRRKALFPFIF